MNRPRIGDEVRIRYTCSTEDGTILESTPEAAPVTAILGQGMLLPALEDALMAMESGGSRRLVLEAADAFGEYREELRGEVPLESFSPDLRPEVGIMVEIAGEADAPPMQGTVVAVHEDSAEIDGNHPLAGQRLVYDLTLIACVRQA